MSIFGDLSYAKPQNIYAGSPVDEIKALNEQASVDYQNTRNKKDDLDVLLSNLQVESRNNHIKVKQIENIKNRFTDLLKNGDYENYKYAVQDATKEFLTNQDLQNAIASQKAKDAYQQDLNNKLQKGEITQKRFNYSLLQSQLNNQAPLSTDENTGQVNNFFNPTKVGKDLSGDIQDDLNKKIESWKAGDLPLIDSKGRKLTYNIDKATGTERILANQEGVGYEEVFNALKQGLKNNQFYKEYFDEENKIDKFNKTFNPETKTNRPLDNSDISFINDEQKKNAFLGFTKEQINQLENSTNVADKKLLDEIRLKESKYDLNNPDVINEIYDKVNSEIQLENAVTPAAKKAAYTKTNLSHFTDQAAVLASKDYYDRLKAEREKPTNNLPPLIETQTKAKLTGEDFNKEKTNLVDLQNKLNEALTVRNNTPKDSPLYKQNEAAVLNLERQVNVSKGQVDAFYNDALSDPKTREKIKDNVLSMFNFNASSSLSNQDFRPSIKNMVSLINATKENRDIYLEKDLQDILKTFNKGEYPNEELAKRVTDRLTSNSKYLPLLSEIDKEKKSRNTISQRPLFGEDTYSGFPETGNVFKKISGTIGGLLFHNTSFSDNIDDIIREKNNKEALTKSNTIYTLNDAGFKNNSTEANNAIQTGRAILQGGDLVLENGKTFDEALLKNKFYRISPEGKKVESKVDLASSYLFPITGVPDNEQWASASLRDKDGNELIMEGDDGEERSNVNIRANNSNAMQTLKREYSKYAIANNDNSKVDDLESDLQFGPYVSKIRGGIDSDYITIPVNVNGTIMGIKVRAKKVNDNTSVLVNEQGEPVYEGTKAYFQGNPSKILYSLQKQLQQ